MLLKDSLIAIYISSCTIHVLQSISHELDNGSMGTSAYMQCHSRGGWVVAARGQPTTRHCNHGNTSGISVVHKQRTEVNQLLSHILTSILYVGYNKHRR
jgi:hypothetical protein